MSFVSYLTSHRAEHKAACLAYLPFASCMKLSGQRKEDIGGKNHLAPPQQSALKAGEHKKGRADVQKNY